MAGIDKTPVQIWEAVVRMNFDKVKACYRRLQTCSGKYIEVDTLKQIDIHHLTDLQWNPEDTIDFDRRFCNPCRKETFDAAFDAADRRAFAGYKGHIIEWRGEMLEDFECRDLSEEAYRQREINKYRKVLGNEIEHGSFIKPKPLGRRDRAELLELALSAALGHPKSSEDIASHGDWYPTYSQDVYHLREEDSEPDAWHMKSIKRAIPWPQPPTPACPKKEQALVQAWYIPLTRELRKPDRGQLGHMACSVIESGEPRNEKLFRSEILAGVSVLQDHMRRWINHLHGIFPVFVYTFTGLAFRVVQMHFDAVTQCIYVRKTPFMQVTGPDDLDGMKLIMRWMMNVPCGDTEYKDIGLDQQTVEKLRAQLVEPFAEAIPV